MRKLYDEFLSLIDGGAIYERTLKLSALEQHQTTPYHHIVADLVLDELKKAGIPNAERIDIVADGKTAYQDKVMPLAWDATVGRLTMTTTAKNKWVPVSMRGMKLEEDPVIADFDRHPFHLVKGSTATPPGGVVAKVMNEAQFLAGDDPRGAMIMLEPTTRAGKGILKPILDQGALGFITDYMVGRYGEPDALQWVNAATESGNWHVIAEDRPFVGFSVSPRTGDLIRQKVHAGGLKVKVECDGRRYVGVEPLVTALIPGESSKEVWLYAHLYEPLLNDDSGGVSTGIEIARALLRRGRLKYSVRLVFAMEYYGYAAYTALRGQNLKNEVIGGCNIDSIRSAKGEKMLLYPSPSPIPYSGNTVLKKLCEEFGEELMLEMGNPTFMDDLFLGDPSIGIPSVWMLGRCRGYWHNSRQCDPNFVDAETMHKSAALAAVFITEVADDGFAPPPPPVVGEAVHTPWRDYAEEFVFARKEQGFPYSLARIPRWQRIALPDGMLYGVFAFVMSALDGKKTLAQAIREAEAASGVERSDADVKKYIDALNLFADYGYVEAVKRPAITGDDIKGALRDLGITQDDLVLVHASVSKCGYIAGGAETIINAIRESAGTALFTTFTRPYIRLGGVNHGWRYRPFDPEDADAVWTGNVGKTVLRKFPDALRSRHITHSWAGFGKLAEACLSAHGPCEPPANENSPLAKALEYGGKIVYFGAGLESTTFIHYLEDATRMPFLATAICNIKHPDGSLEAVAVERHLPGDREFYRDAMNCKFFKRAFERGLELKSVKFGMDRIMVLDIRQLYETGMAVIKDDPKVLLCDNPACAFCSTYR